MNDRQSNIEFAQRETLRKLFGRKWLGVAGIHMISHNLKAETLDLHFDPTLPTYGKDKVEAVVAEAQRLAGETPVRLVLSPTVQAAGGW